MNDHHTDSNANTPLPQGEESPPAGVKAMAIVRWGLILAMAALAVISLATYLASRSGSAVDGAVYHCPMHPQITSNAPGSCPICGMDLVPGPSSTTKRPSSQTAESGNQKRPLFTCPMHPEFVTPDAQARCPKCGMKLEPASEDLAAKTQAHAAEAQHVPGLVPIELGAEWTQKIGVKTAAAAVVKLAGRLRTVGVLESNERGRVSVSTRYAGWVEKLFVNETGQLVKSGQVVAHIYSPDVLQAQEELLSALGWEEPQPSSEAKTQPHPEHLNLTSALAKDARQRLLLLGVAMQDVDAIVREKKARPAVPLRAPSSGFVMNKNVIEGGAVTPGMPLLEVVDLSTLWLVADVYEGDASQVKLGTRATFHTAAYPAESFTAKVSFLYPLVDPVARTLRVRLELPNKMSAGRLKLRPGMYGDVVFETPASEALMIPVEALVDTGDVQYVFISLGEGRFVPRRVAVGVRRAGQIEIVTGLEVGDVVVTTANFLLDSESRLQGTLQGAQDGTPAPSSSASPTPAPAPPHAH